MGADLRFGGIKKPGQEVHSLGLLPDLENLLAGNGDCLQQLMRRHLVGYMVTQQQ